MTEREQALIGSPCIRNCCLDDHDICLGCHRSITEIINWNATGNQERSAILLRCGLRREQRHNRRVGGEK